MTLRPVAARRSCIRHGAELTPQPPRPPVKPLNAWIDHGVVRRSRPHQGLIQAKSGRALACRLLAAAVMINPSRIRILAVGKVRKGWLNEGVALYRRRLPGLELLELRDAGMAREAELIRSALRPDERLVVLTEEGRTFPSTAFAQRLEGSGSERLAFVIGGADGIDPSLKAQASWQLSLSPMTFPHELARLLLLEQLYRALSIQQGGPYHRA